MKILISGGHLTPALAFIDYVQEKQPSDELVFAGRLYSQDRVKQTAQEKSEVEQRGIKFIPFKAVRFSRRQPLTQLLLLPLRFMAAIFQGKQLLQRERPDIFLSFGGYLAVPLAIAAKLSGIPVVTHEQTSTAGFATRLIAKLANAVAISFPQSAANLPAQKVVVTGNPLRAQIFHHPPQLPDWMKQRPQLPVLLITGGNQGSFIINQLIKEVLPEITAKWTVIHLCGNPTSQLNYREELESARQKLPSAQQSNYYVKEWISGDELAWVYSQTQAAVSRGGANTVAELSSLNIPAIYIPLPHAHHDEQTKNVQPLVEQNASLMLPQSDLTPANFLQQLTELDKKLSVFKKNLTNINHANHASRLLYQVLTQVTSHAQVSQTA